VAAFVLDGIVLGILGMVAGFFLFDYFAQLGGWGRLVGFGVGLVYFGVLNSAVGRGRTVGKRIMGIEVVDATGGHISVGCSLLRYTILGLPFFLNGAAIPSAGISSSLLFVIGFLVFGVGGAVVYLYLFNRRTRQSLHDLAVGTFVVRSGPAGPFAPAAVWRGHLFVVGVWGLASIGLLFGVGALSGRSFFADLLVVQQKLQASGKVHSATVLVGKNWSYVNGVRREASSLQTTVVWIERPKDYQLAAEEMAAIILANYPEVRSKDTLNVTVCYGYDIGIAQAWIRQSFPKSPREWARLLGQRQ
jgi:uncharacterized RDD family membrane protein YckC